MAVFKFTDAIMADRPIDVYNGGEMKRDFTYIDDIVTAIVRVTDRIAEPASEYDPYHPDPATSSAPYRIYNIGNHQPTNLMDFIATLERALGKTAIKNMLPMQPGDVVSTYADVEALKAAVEFSPSTSIEFGIKQFVQWYREYYRV
jgi:UDP-glucuronate 4-epimerase